MTERLERIAELAQLLRYAAKLNKPTIHDLALDDLQTELDAYTKELTE